MTTKLSDSICTVPNPSFLIQLRASLIPIASANFGVTRPNRQVVIAYLNEPRVSRRAQAKLNKLWSLNMAALMLSLKLPWDDFVQVQAPSPGLIKEAAGNRVLSWAEFHWDQTDLAK